MPIEESSAAIVLRARDYSESDRIVTLLTRDFGKLSGMAKGAKASRKRFERKLEPFSHVMLYFRRRPNGQLVFVTRAEASPDLTPFAIEDDLDENRARQLHARTRRRIHLRRSGGDRRVSRAGGGARSGQRRSRDARAAPGIRTAHAALGRIWTRFCAMPQLRRCDIAVGILHHRARRRGLRAMPPDDSRRRAEARRGQRVGIGQPRRVRISRTALDARAAAADGALAISRFVASVLDRRLRSIAFLDSVLSRERLRKPIIRPYLLRSRRRR